MKTDDNDKQDSSSAGPQSRLPTRPRAPYTPPRLAVWGSLVDLTGGPLLDVADGDFTGSGGA